MSATKSQYAATAKFHERIAAEFAKRGNVRDAEAAKRAAAAARAKQS